MTTLTDPNYFADFARALARSGPGAIHAGEIGRDLRVATRDGAMPMLYADYTATGRALRQVEEAVMTDVLPWYANSHSRQSLCGRMMNAGRAAARAYVAEQIGAGTDCAVIFTGSGATAGINRLVHLFGLPEAVAAGRPVRVILGPWEHHSNILPWRESGAEVIALPEARTGGPCAETLDRLLSGTPAGALAVVALSAGSNVTGELADVPALTAIARRHDARTVWDYAACAPYVPVDMTPGGHPVDAIVLSPHKFVGGPGASGVLCLRRSSVAVTRPTFPGGGSVSFVSPWAHVYSTDLCEREEAGTPNVIGDLRAAYAFAVKSAIGADLPSHRLPALVRQAEEALDDIPGLTPLGRRSGPRLPILSFLVHAPDGAPVSSGHAVRVLSDQFGIQARSGWACAGPFAHRLLDIDAPESHAIAERIAAGDDTARPGFVRLNLSALMTDAEVDRILAALRALPACAAGTGSSRQVA
ncbi:aminotransferase class V [Primorskyibacter flagellatus]|uniref:Aminotransferase class V n=1 Tax=Primorskyibacter flagellatus TaxID=1387277 RepID=A0A917A579_9RHOB|nr:aminotransferase class V-fold PLP-dependent enzyme [Primorskyibacter flagellatus]GGE27767.1 aminotransferase class V [Primorskyibacter flagellatus]